MTACCASCNTFSLGFGVSAATHVVGLILHWQSRYLVDPVRGLVYGRLGKVMGRNYGDGYIRLGWGAGRAGHQYAHRLIWETVYGPIPEGHYIDHLNGKRADNRVVNLDAVTPTENLLRALDKGRVPTGDLRSDAKLTAEQVCEIRRTAKRISTREWARELGLDPRTIRDARAGRSWRHICCHRDGSASVRPARRTGRRPRRRTPKEVG